MARQAAHAPQIVRSIDDPLAEVIVPDAIDDAAPGQRVARIGNPFGEGSTAISLALRLKGGVERGHAFERAGADGLQRLLDVAAPEDEDRRRLLRRAII